MNTPYPLLTLCASAMLLTACATSPLGRNQFMMLSNEQVDNMGVQAFSKLKQEQPATQNQVANQFVTCIASAITEQVGGNWEVVVFEDATLNAFALPGNKIGVHTGLVNLVANADQLAAVIGHEIGHVQAHHGNERMSQEMAVQQGLAMSQALFNPQSALGQVALGTLGIGAQYGIVLPYSRLHETEADIIGLQLMAKAGFNPKESVNLWVKMGQASKGQNPPELMSTHPSDQTRIQELQKHMPEAIALQQSALAAGKQPQCHK